MAAALSLLQSQVETRRMIGLLKQKLDSLLIKNLFLNVNRLPLHSDASLTINGIYNLNIVQELLCPRDRVAPPHSGVPAGNRNYRLRGNTVRMAVSALGQMWAAPVTPAEAQERAQVHKLREDAQQATGHSVQRAWADQGDTGKAASKAAQDNGIDLQIVKLPNVRGGKCMTRSSETSR